jgi:hypothetical protein
MFGNGPRCANLQACSRRLRKGHGRNSVFALPVFALTLDQLQTIHVADTKQKKLRY